MTNKIQKKQDFIELYNPNKCLDIYSKCTSVNLAIKDKSPSLAKIRKEYDKDYVVKYICFWLIDLNNYLNISRKLNANQVQEIASMIYADHYNLKISDINLIFKRIKTGHYGQFYESIDGVKILDIFNKYQNERSEICFNENLVESDKIKYKDSKFNLLDRRNSKK